MVRHYKRKGTTMKWTEKDLADAIEHVKQHKNVMAASKLYKIPPTTLRSQIKRGMAIKKPGHPTVLTTSQEEEIVCSNGLGRREVEGIIQNFFKVTKKPNPFHNGVPGER